MGIEKKINKKRKSLNEDAKQCIFGTVLIKTL